MNMADVAWVAGLLEGEGTFFISSGPHPHASLMCAMTDEDVLLKLQRLVGGTLIGPKMGKKSTKPYWSWQLSRREELLPLVRSLLPWLGARRAAKARLMLQLMRELDMAKIARLNPCGTRAKYERGCRCESCTRARYWHNVRMKAKRAEKGAA